MRLERWPEGFVIWFGGQIVFKSWEKKEVDVTVKIDSSDAQDLIDDYIKSFRVPRQTPNFVWDFPI